MKKFELSIPYVGYKYITVEAESEEEAIKKAFNDGLINSEISLCWYCSKEIGELFLDDENIVADEI